MLSSWAAQIWVVGIALVVLGTLWIVALAFAHRWWQGFLMLLGSVLLIGPPVYVLWHFRRTWRAGAVWLTGVLLVAGAFALGAFDAAAQRGPVARQEVEAGQSRATLTFTGVTEPDYQQIAQSPDLAVLQMANGDVTDETLKFLARLTRLEELDLSTARITDAGLPLLAELPALKSLRLRETGITEAGFITHLRDKESLMQLDLSRTAVSAEVADAWAAAKPGRRVRK